MALDLRITHSTLNMIKFTVLFTLLTFFVSGKLSPEDISICIAAEKIVCMENNDQEKSIGSTSLKNIATFRSLLPTASSNYRGPGFSVKILSYEMHRRNSVEIESTVVEHDGRLPRNAQQIARNCTVGDTIIFSNIILKQVTPNIDTLKIDSILVEIN